MKSPFTGKEMKLQKERRVIEFRKEKFEVTFHYWYCADSKQQFTTTALDEINIGQAYNQFRTKHKLPFPEEIKEIREKYELSAAKMSEILGLGANAYRQYEAGEVPSESNARLIQLARDPHGFRNLLMLCTTIEAKAHEKILRRIDGLIQAQEAKNAQDVVRQYVMGPQAADEYSGYRRPNLEKFAAMVAIFAEALKPFKTKLNKLLFYADFNHFGKTCSSISGMRYDAIQMGPVPHNFNSLYQMLAEKNVVHIEYVPFSADSIGERFEPASEANPSVLSEAEKETIQNTIDYFKNTSSQDIIFISHLESAWRDTVDQRSRAISYLQYAFDLSVQYSATCH